jgi:hypothetical protein
MSLGTAKQTAAQAKSASASSFSANKYDPSRDVSEPSQPPLNSDNNRRSGLIEVDLDILAAHRRPRRNGSGCFSVLTVAHPEYREAVCFSAELPFAVAAGQKVRILGRRDEYQGKPQIILQAWDISLVAQAADNPDLVSVEVTVGRISMQSPSRTWKAFTISSGGFESASGDISFDIHDGQRLRLHGFKGAYKGRPQLLVTHAEPLDPDYADDRRRIFTQHKIQPRYADDLVATLGSDFAARVIEDPELIDSALPRTKTATRVKVREACARIEAQDAFSTALRRCSVAEPTVAALIAKHPTGLARMTAYDLIDYGVLDDDDANRGPRRGLTGGQADKLAQSDYALKFRPFDPQSLERARCFAEHLARERIELRGDAGASISNILGDLEKRFAFTRAVTQKSIALLAEERAFTIDPSQPDRLWLRSEAQAEAAVAESVRARVARGDGRAPTRRVAKHVALFPASNEPRPTELSPAQRAAAKMALENQVSIICGPPGVGKTAY